MLWFGCSGVGKFSVCVHTCLRAVKTYKLLKHYLLPAKVNLLYLPASLKGTSDDPELLFGLLYRDGGGRKGKGSAVLEV